MIEGIALGLVIILAGSLGLNGWLTYRTVRGSSKEADERVAQNEVENLLEREKFEHEVTKKAYARSKKRASILEQEFMHEIGQPFPDADIAPDDHRARVQRFVEAWREADDADGGEVPAEPVGAVPVAQATRSTGAPAILSKDDDTGLEVL